MAPERLILGFIRFRQVSRRIAEGEETRKRESA